MNRSLVLASLAFCAAASLSANAVAGPPATRANDDQIVRTVSLADLNLHTEAGAKVAALRIRLAAAYVCGGDNALVRSGSKFNACRSKAMDRALAGVDAPMVLAALGRPTLTDLAQR
ncbi:MAG: UrcA family protein [Phenylobacterium sp.]